MLFVSYELEPVPILVLPTLPWERIREASDKSKATCQMWSEAESGVPLGLPIHNLRFSVNQPWESVSPPSSEAGQSDSEDPSCSDYGTGGCLVEDHAPGGWLPLSK